MQQLLIAEVISQILKEYTVIEDPEELSISLQIFLWHYRNGCVWRISKGSVQ